MQVLNYEFKAKAYDLERLEQKLLPLNPIFKGEDHQIDTYFKVAEGRLKLREGIIENALIYYQRQDLAGAKQSDVLLYKHSPEPGLKKILTKVHGVVAVVDKLRKIYFIENVKFHFDKVKGLGTFVEVEAIDENGDIGLEKLQSQCQHYFELFELDDSDYVTQSYSDLILQ